MDKKENGGSYLLGCFAIIAIPFSIWFIYMLFTVGPNWDAFTPGRIGAFLCLIIFGLWDEGLIEFPSFFNKNKSNNSKYKDFEEWWDSFPEEDEKDENYYNEVDQQNEEQLEKKYAKVLGLSGKVIINDIRTAYREIIKQYHPDKVATMGEEIKSLAEEKTKKLNEAYEYFMNKYG